MKILLVEDDDGISQIISYILEEDGHRLFIVTQEEEVERVLLDEKIDIILMDVSLGGGDGGKIAKRLKKSKGKTVPIVLMSAHPDLEELCRKVGADGYLVKPFDISELLSIVHKFRAK